MTDAPSPRRRFQFRLRTLLIGVTLLAGVCGYVGWQAKIVRERHAIAREVSQLHGGVFSESRLEAIFGQGKALEEPLEVGETTLTPPYPTISLLRKWPGDEGVLAVVIPESVPASTVARVKAAFPEALVVQSPRVLISD
jgi:hypothetical protein